MYEDFRYLWCLDFLKAVGVHSPTYMNRQFHVGIMFHQALVYNRVVIKCRSYNNFAFN